MVEVALQISPLNGPGYPIMPQLCTCATNYPSPGCWPLLSNNTYPAGFTPDTATQSYISALPSGTPYMFGDAVTYYDYNPPYSSSSNYCRDDFFSGSLIWTRTFEVISPVTWIQRAYTGSFAGGEKVGVGVGKPLETLHVASNSDATNIPII